MAFICRFVDAISASPTVRFDFEAGPWEVRPGLDVPPPALRGREFSGMSLGGGSGGSGAATTDARSYTFNAVTSRPISQREFIDMMRDMEFLHG